MDYIGSIFIWLSTTTIGVDLAKLSKLKKEMTSL